MNHIKEDLERSYSISWKVILYRKAIATPLIVFLDQDNRGKHLEIIGNDWENKK
jgi:hypothetical protein